MSDTLTLRWAESERYDIETDSMVVQFQAITSRGTWYSEWSFELLDGYKGIAKLRKQFQERALEDISAGLEPGWVDMEEVQA